MKRGSALRTLKFIFISVILFVLTFTAVVITMLNIYSPKFLATIDGKEVAYFTSPAEFDETYEKLKAEKKVDGVESDVYLVSNPEFELKYVKNSAIEEENQYTNLREYVKAEYTTYSVYVKDNKEMTFATKKEADEYADKIKSAVKTSVKSTVKVAKETSEELGKLTDKAVATKAYNSIVSRYKPVVRQTSYGTSTGIYYSGGTKYAQKATGTLNAFMAGGRRPASGVLTQGYGPSRAYSSGMHGAIDIASMGHANVNIYPYKAGTVIRAGWSGSYGNRVIVYHGKDEAGNEFYTLYAHFKSLNVSVGQSVNQGTVLGLMGTTGYSTGVHLHFEMYSVLNNAKTMYNPSYYV